MKKTKPRTNGMLKRIGFRVRYSETDRMGIVHHSNYFCWFETARMELLEDVGLRAVELEEQGLYLPLVEARCRYVRPCVCPERIEIAVGIMDLTPVKLSFRYEVIKQEGEEKGLVAARGSTVHCFAARSSYDGRLHAVKAPQWIMERLETLIYSSTAP